MTLAPEVLVYPAHGAGSLCGKALSSERVSTIGQQLQENYAPQPMSEDKFVDTLMEGQPFIPKYFGFNVGLNKAGAPSYQESIDLVPRVGADTPLEPGVMVIDTRPEEQFKAGHVAGAINLMDGGKFETWLGSIMGPSEQFYLIAESEEARETVIQKAAKIGYEPNIKGAMLAPAEQLVQETQIDLSAFKQDPSRFTIVDIRNVGEYESGALFSDSLNIPLAELRERAQEIPTAKPIVVHCAGGYQSAAGTSIVRNELGGMDILT